MHPATDCRTTSPLALGSPMLPHLHPAPALAPLAIDALYTSPPR